MDCRCSLPSVNLDHCFHFQFEPLVLFFFNDKPVPCCVYWRDEEGGREVITEVTLSVVFSGARHSLITS